MGGRTGGGEGGIAEILVWRGGMLAETVCIKVRKWMCTLSLMWLLLSFMQQKEGVFKFGGQQKGQGWWQTFSRYHLDGVIVEYISEIHEESKGRNILVKNYIYGYILFF